MSDIVERLRNPVRMAMVDSANGASGNSIAVLYEEKVVADMNEAADEIERLRDKLNTDAAYALQLNATIEKIRAAAGRPSSICVSYTEKNGLRQATSTATVIAGDGSIQLLDPSGGTRSHWNGSEWVARETK